MGFFVRKTYLHYRVTLFNMSCDIGAVPHCSICCPCLCRPPMYLSTRSESPAILPLDRPPHTLLALLQRLTRFIQHTPRLRPNTLTLTIPSGSTRVTNASSSRVRRIIRRLNITRWVFQARPRRLCLRCISCLERARRRTVVEDRWARFTSRRRRRSGGGCS